MVAQWAGCRCRDHQSLDHRTEAALRRQLLGCLGEVHQRGGPMGRSGVLSADPRHVSGCKPTISCDAASDSAVAWVERCIGGSNPMASNAALVRMLSGRPSITKVPAVSIRSSGRRFVRHSPARTDRVALPVHRNSTSIEAGPPATALAGCRRGGCGGRGRRG